MFARVTKFKVKSEAVDEARALFRSLEPEIDALPGVIQFSVVMQDNGIGYLLGFIESEEQANQNAVKVRDLWMKFAPYLEAIPVPEGYEVVGCWTPQKMQPVEL